MPKPKRLTRLLFVVGVICLVCASCATPNSPSNSNGTIDSIGSQIQPEAASLYAEKPGWQGRHFAVATANPLATAAGYQMLKAGGSAVDAAVAVQMVLTLVEPQSSGIGGGAFMLHHDGKATQAFDGRETAPSSVTDQHFLDPSGQALAFERRILGGRSVGVPGVVSLLELAHRQHGKLPWASLFAPAIALSEQGFPVSQRLHILLSKETQLQQDPIAAAYFYDQNRQPWPVGHLLKNPALASVFKQIAATGAQALLQGDIAQAIVRKVSQHPTAPGPLSLTDLAAYQVKLREPLCHDLPTSSKTYLVCGMPAPSSGALTVGQILGLLQHTPAASLPLEQGKPTANWLHYYSEASRLAFADRARYIADPDFVAPPAGRWASLLDPAYLRQRASLISPVRMPSAPAGSPGGWQSSYADMPAQAELGTSHLSIIDPHGNALAMTTSIEAAFGARQMVSGSGPQRGGFLLNNQLSDFSPLAADAQGRPIANRIEPGKRPRSSMAPTLVFDKTTGQLVLSGGSPGGAMILHYTAKLLYGTLLWELTPQQAINLPNFGAVEQLLFLEKNRFPQSTLATLRTKGATIREEDLSSGLQAIVRQVHQGEVLLRGGADPRREGLVMGE